MNNKALILLVALMLVAGGAYYFWSTQEPAAPVLQPTVVALPPIEKPEPEISFPIEEIAQPPAPIQIEEQLPSLAESDLVIAEWLAGVVDPASFQDLLVPEQIISRIVATIDSLTSRQVAPQIRPVQPVAGKLVVTGDKNAVVLDPENYTRYDSYIALAELLDVELLVAAYVRFYPLFQEAYEALGYPDLYFNDRVVEVIDHLLLTPEPDGPIYLVKPEAFYLYADPALERLSGGQKILIRMGRNNAASVKLKLTQIRDRIIGRSAM